jgi:hypothetical protein
MNLTPVHASRITFHEASLTPRPGRQSGSAVIVVMALVAIILVYVAGNLRTLHNLGRELRFIERQQVQRLQKASHSTNAPSAITIATNSVPLSLAR